MKFMQFLSNRQALPKDRTLNLRFRLAVIIAGITVVAMAHVLDAVPRAVDQFYSEGIGPWIGLGLAKISSLVPFSLVESIAGLLLLSAAVSAARAIYNVARRTRRLSNALGCAILRSATALALLVAFFYAGWGFSFSRPRMITRFGWQKVLATKTTQDLADELAQMSDGLVRAANDDYTRAFNSHDVGAPSKLPIPMAKVDAAIEEGYRRLTRELRLKPHFALTRGPIKPVAVSPFLSRVLILGFYSPWTGEAHYNTQMVSSKIPQVVAHEKAHQRCITSEDEANFFGILACVLSDEPYVRYSGYLAAQKQLLNQLYDIDPERAEKIAEKRIPGVQRDRQAENNFIISHLGVLSEAGHAVNDAYLKANRVSEGVQSYNMDTQLLIAFTRAHGPQWYKTARISSADSPQKQPLQ